MAKISAIASYLPDKVLTNDELSERFSPWTSEKIFNKTGIQERRIADKQETSCDLAIQAAKVLFKKNNLEKSKIRVAVFSPLL